MLRPAASRARKDGPAQPEDPNDRLAHAARATAVRGRSRRPRVPPTSRADRRTRIPHRADQRPAPDRGRRRAWAGVGEKALVHSIVTRGVSGASRARNVESDLIVRSGYRTGANHTPMTVTMPHPHGARSARGARAAGDTAGDSGCLPPSEPFCWRPVSQLPRRQRRPRHRARPRRSARAPVQPSSHSRPSRTASSERAMRSPCR